MMILSRFILLSAAMCAFGVETAPLRTFQDSAYGFAIDYPADMTVKESKAIKGGYLRRISFYGDPADEEPCFMIDVQPLKSLSIELKTRGTYRYYQKKRKWVLEPGYEEESLNRLAVSYLGGTKIPIYSSLHSMANAYRDDAVLTDKNYAFVLHYSDASKRRGVREVNAGMAASFRLIGVKAITAEIVEPPPAAE